MENHLGTLMGFKDISYKKLTSLDEITSMRNQYLDNLLLSQEYYVELEVQKACPYVIQIDGEDAGYFIVSAKDAILEFYISPPWIAQNDIIFGEIITQFEIKTGWCKTFDHNMLACCLEYQKSARVLGILFREYKGNDLPPFPPDIQVRLAEPSDEARIQEINEEIFDHPDEVPAYINARQIFLFEKIGDLVGFGIFSRCIPNRPNFDIGMLVIKKYRRNGYACQILRYLINYCRQNGWQVGAGCHSDNLASRRALEKTGFFARYRLVEFSF
jgi:RimJ/RimL family protein N-acetyltransferase